MLPVALTLAPALTTPSALGLPSNFWLLRQEGVVSTAEDQLVAAYISSLRTGDSAAAERDLDALLARPVAVEFEPSGASGAVVELSDGTLMEELNAAERHPVWLWWLSDLDAFQELPESKLLASV